MCEWLCIVFGYRDLHVCCCNLQVESIYNIITKWCGFRIQHLTNYIIAMEFILEILSSHKGNIPPILHQTQRGFFLCRRRTFLHWFAMPRAIDMRGSQLVVGSWYSSSNHPKYL